MPLIASVLITPPPPPLPPQTPRVRLIPKRLTWTSPAGDVLDLCDDGQGYRSLPGRAGFGMVPREIQYDALPGGGATLRNIHDQVRVLAVPLRVAGLTQDEYLTHLARLQRAFRHSVGGEDVPGTLTVEMPDGSRRSISAFYNGGLDPTEDIDDLLQLGQPFPRLEFLALDPYWLGSRTVGAAWKVDESVPFFGTMPVQLAADQVLGAVTVNVPGDASAYPVWTITGPGVPQISNTTTGRSWEFKVGSPIDAGRTVTVDTRPDQLTVTDDLGEDLYSSLEPFPDMWSLEPGVNELTVEITSATTDSRISFTAATRHQTGW